MNENYEQELKLIEAVEKSRGMEWIDELENFGNYFNPAHMRQRIEREEAKDSKILEQDARIKELEDAMQEFVDKVDNGYARSIRTYTRFKELLK